MHGRADLLGAAIRLTCIKAKTLVFLYRSKRLGAPAPKNRMGGVRLDGANLAHPSQAPQKGEFTMKRLLLAFVTLAVATAFTAPAFAGILDAKNKTECEKAGGVWVEKDKKCGAKKQ